MLDRLDRRLATLPNRITVGGSFALALLVRMGWLMLRASPPDGDEREYMGFATNIAQHFQFKFHLDGPLEGHSGPVLPYLMAPLIKLGSNPVFAGWLVSLLAGSLAVALLYPLGRRLWLRPTAAAAAVVLASFHPAFVSASKHIYPEALSALFLVLGALALTSSRWPGLWFGVAVGMASLTRREYLLVLPFGLAILWFARRDLRDRRRREVLWATAAFIVLFGPYLVYVRAITGHWTLSSEADFAFLFGRAMEQRVDRVVPVAELDAMEKIYPSPWDYVAAKPLSTAVALTRTTFYHLRTGLFALDSWPIGILAILGFLVTLFRRELRRFALLVALLPFPLTAAWAIAGPFPRYSKALAPFICLLAAALLARARDPASDR